MWAYLDIWHLKNYLCFVYSQYINRFVHTWTAGTTLSGRKHLTITSFCKFDSSFHSPGKGYIWGEDESWSSFHWLTYIKEITDSVQAWYLIQVVMFFLFIKLQFLTKALTWFIKPLKAGKSLHRTISAQDFSVNHGVAGFGKGLSRAMPPVRRNLHSLSSISFLNAKQINENRVLWQSI